MKEAITGIRAVRSSFRSVQPLQHACWYLDKYIWCVFTVSHSANMQRKHPGHGYRVTASVQVTHGGVHMHICAEQPRG